MRLQYKAWAISGEIALRCFGLVAIPAAREEELARCFEVYA